MHRFFAWILLGLALVFTAACGGGNCTPQTCSGCCDSKGVCQTVASVNACGAGGSTCEVCPAGNVCSSGACKPGPFQDGGSACASTCNGCCDADGGCTSGTSGSACGTGGAACQACVGLQTCSALGCDDPTCNGCVDSSGACQPGNVDTACGLGGYDCHACTNGASCQNGVCTGGSCSGCVDAFGVCQPGNTHGACGQNGTACAACTSAQACGAQGCTALDGGSCTPNASACNSNSDCCSAYCDATFHCGERPACLPACPSGYTCGPGGICEGGSDQGLVFNVLTPAMVQVSGVIQHNGASPVDCPSTDGYATNVVFTNKNDSNYSTYVPVNCGAAFAFTATVAAGTYDISVDSTNSGNSQITGLPAWSVTVQSNVAINGNASDTLNVVTPPMVQVSGTIQHNGASPVDCPSTDGYATNVVFANKTDSNYSTYIPVNCGAAFAFTATVAAGTYDISVDSTNSGNSQITGLPAWSVKVQSGVAINGNSSDTLNVVTPPMVQVSGTIQHNGASPVDCPSTDGYATNVVFANKTDSNYSTYVPVNCGAAFAFTATVAAGTYDISVDSTNSGNSQITGLPAWSVQVQSGVAINGNSSDTLNVVTPPTVQVSGVIQHNGAAPVDCPSTDGYATNVVFSNKTDSNYSTYVPVNCGSAFAFTANVASGTYDISVDSTNSGNSQITGLPAWSVKVQSGVAINGNSSDTLNVMTPTMVQVAGLIQHNGAAPVDCPSTDGYATNVIFTNQNDSNYSTYFPINCGAAFNFTGSVATGTYAVYVDSTNSGNSQITGLPAWSVDVVSAIKIP